MDVAVRDTPRWEVDAVAAQNPWCRRVELCLRGKNGSVAVFYELPHERGAGDTGRSRMRLVSLQVVRDPVPRLGFDPVRAFIERELQ